MRPYTMFLYSLLYVVALAPWQACASGYKPWTYRQNAYELYSPQLSPDGSMLVFVRLWHVPTGHEREMLSKKALQRYNAAIKKDAGLAYPEIMLMHLSR